MSGLTKSGRAVAGSGRWLVAAMLVLGATNGARAQDFFEFLNNAFGGGGQQRQAQPQPDMAAPDSPPLTVRPHRRLHRPLGTAPSGGIAGRGQRYDVAEIRGTTIYTDRTLSRGDAVMTDAGIKVFNGSSSWPYTRDDFIALSSGKMPTLVRKELTAMDAASRPALQRN